MKDHCLYLTLNTHIIMVSLWNPNAWWIKKLAEPQLGGPLPKLFVQNVVYKFLPQNVSVLDQSDHTWAYT